MTRDQIVKYHKLLCKKLGIPSCRVITRPDINTYGHIGFFRHTDHTIYVSPKDHPAKGRFKAHSAKWVIAHETYHWYQVHTGMLGITHYRGAPKRYWEEKNTWSSLPWERAANRFADKIIASNFG